MGEGDDAEDRQLAARVVNGINCTPYDKLHAWGYLSAILNVPGEHHRIAAQTCLGEKMDFLRRLEGDDAEDRQLAARVVNGINCTPYDMLYQWGYLRALLAVPGEHHRIAAQTCLGGKIDFLRRLWGEKTPRNASSPRAW